MALLEEVKKGGPYTKKEQDERRNEVFKLHFEKRYSAVKISEKLNVNRNTINEDIRYWYAELSQELNHDVVTWAIEQFQSFELQKNRLVEQLEKVEPIEEKIAIEKLIFQIDDKVSQFISKLISSKVAVTYPQNNENLLEKTKDFVRNLLLDGKKRTNILDVGDLKFNIIKRYTCDADYADSIVDYMQKLGLYLCGDSKATTNIYGLPDAVIEYDILKFAEMRGFLSESEIHQVKKKSKIT